MNNDLDATVQAETRRKMFHWFVRMGHQTQFDDEASFVSYGDLVQRRKPSLRQFFLETVSISALAMGSRNYGTA